MKKLITIGLLLILPGAIWVQGQNSKTNLKDTLMFKGQFSSYANYNYENDMHLWLGGRYIPQVNYDINLNAEHLIDFEASANLYGNLAPQLSDTSSVNGNIKPYRFWARYSSSQFELRLGLQKINFGSASMLRPLMWFDQVDSRDPLRLTDGVWGLLARYYFLNNANIWLWALYGNENKKGWEQLKTNTDFPELGGRLQMPLPQGEAALSYHFRMADLVNPMRPSYDRIPENRIGFDIRYDYYVGCWLEGSWINKGMDLGEFTNLEILNAGIDYTIGIGNGIYLVYEQLIASADEKAFGFSNTTTFSLLSASYPIGLFDNLSAMVYYDWKTNSTYNFLNWQKQFDNLTLYVMAFWNPKDYDIPTQSTEQSLFAGQGVQVMLVYNH